MVFVDAVIPRAAPMEDVFHDVESVLHLAAHTGFPALNLLFLLPSQTVHVVAFESADLLIDTIFPFDAVFDIIF